MKAFFPAILEADDVDGGFVVEVVGTGVNGEGETDIAALENAAEILQDVIWADVAAGRPIPTPGTPSADDKSRGTVAMIQATLPAVAAE